MPTIYSEGYSAIWEMWDQITQTRSPGSAATAKDMVENLLRLLPRFLRRQVITVAQGGWPVFQRKASLLLTLPLAVPIVILARLIRPLVLIRFGLLNGPPIGHLAAETELYLCERDAGMHDERAVDVFYHLHPISNYTLKKKWGQILHVSFLARPAELVNGWLPGGRRHVIPKRRDRDVHGLMVGTSPHISFDSKEERLGQEALGRLGIPEGSPFICFYARDSEYARYWNRINYRRPYAGGYCEYRDSPIESYFPAVEELAHRGNFMLRMGSIVKEPLETDNPLIIDYATKARTDFLDIFLSANCRFFIGDTGGLIGVPRIFRRPIVYVNLIYFSPQGLLLCAPSSLFIPKRSRLRGSQSFMTFSEIIQSGTGWFKRDEQYQESGIELVDNTPEEITAVALEMDARLRGTWATTEEDEELQRRFLELFQPKEEAPIAARIGAEFLRQNRQLLG